MLCVCAWGIQEAAPANRTKQPKKAAAEQEAGKEGGGKAAGGEAQPEGAGARAAEAAEAEAEEEDSPFAGISGTMGWDTFHLVRVGGLGGWGRGGGGNARMEGADTMCP